MGAEPSVLIAGAGTMGHGIAVCFAGSGWRVTLMDPSAAALERARARIQAALELIAGVEGAAASSFSEAMARVATVSRLPDSVPEIVIEAVPEQLGLKREVLRELASRGAAETLLCTNTSAFAISSLAEGLPHPGRLVGTHFWNPPYAVPCVEVVRGDATTGASMDQAVGLLRAIGRRPVRVDRDVPGFVGNRLQHALLREALALVESGVVSPEDLDDVVKHGFGLRLALMGPFERADLGGLDTTCRVQEYLLPYLDQRTTPSPLLTAKVDKGELGVKSGQGFFAWDEGTARERIQRRDETLLRIIRLRPADE